MRSWIPSLAVAYRSAGAVASIAALAACSPERAVAPAPRTTPGAAASGLPSVDSITLERGPARLDTALRGKVALVSLWATWCESCAREFDALNRLDERARGRGAVVVGVAVGEPAGTVADFVRRRGLRYTQLVDEAFTFADAIGQRQVPTTLVIDRSGKVVFVGGALDERALGAFRAALDAG